MAEEGPRPTIYSIGYAAQRYNNQEDPSTVKNRTQYQTYELQKIFENTDFDPEKITKLFSDGILSANTRNPHRSNGNLLHWVIERSDIFKGKINGIINILVENGVDVNGLDEFRRAPIFAAVEQDNLNAVLALTLKDADLRIKDSSGKNLLFFARSKPMAELLVQLGVPYEKNSSNRTPANNKTSNLSIFGRIFGSANKEVKELEKTPGRIEALKYFKNKYNNIKRNRNFSEGEANRLSELLDFYADLEFKQYGTRQLNPPKSGGKQTRRNNRKNRKTRKTRK